MAARWRMLVLFGAVGAAATSAIAAVGDAPSDGADARAAGLVGFAPPDSLAATRGRAVAERFALGHRYELTFRVANAFSAENRAAIARLEAALAATPGVRRVAGPARLLAVEAADTGRVVATPMFAVDPACTPPVGRVSSLGGPASGLSPGDALVRERVGRRGDAAGWFVSTEGTTLRLQIEVDEGPPPPLAIDAALASSGLAVVGGEIPVAAVWPDPARDEPPFPPALPLGLALVAALPLLAVGMAARPNARRFAVAVVAMGGTLAAPGLAAPVVAVRSYAVYAGLASIGLGAGLWLLSATPGFLRRRRRKLAPPEPGRLRGGRRASVVLVIGSLLLVIAAIVSSSRLQLRSALSRDPSLLFVDVRADIAEPVVLRQIRAFVADLRGEPGIAGAWSVADLFEDIPRAATGVGGIPDDREAVARILYRASADPAVALELGPSQDEALIAVRLVADSAVDPGAVVDRVEHLARRDLDRALARVDVNDGGLSLAVRTFGRGLLVEHALARVTGSSERAGHALGDEQIRRIDRRLRQVTLLPRVDRGTFAADVGREVAKFLEEVAVAERGVAPPQAAQRQRLVAALLGHVGEPSLQDVVRALCEMGGPKLATNMCDARGAELRRRFITLRRRSITQLAAKEILADADLPTEGGLSDEVRDATLEAMGPIVGVPAPPSAPGALMVDAAVVGGVVCDRALSLAWAPRMRVAVLAAAVAGALLLLGLGGLRALSWWPATLAPGAVVLLVPAIAGIPMGILVASVLAGALGGGAAFGVAASGVERRSASGGRLR